MWHGKLLIILTLAGLGPTLAWPQTLYQQDEPPAQTQDIPPAGFWPTPRMMELFIDRIVEDVAHGYDFDEDQLYNTRELWKERFPTWLNAHRGDIMQLTNEYLEALLAGQPPDLADVADWAQRALPLFEEFFDLCEQVNEEMRIYMTEEQQIFLDGHMAGFRVGAGYLTRRLSRWSEGGFDAQTEWPGSPDHYQAELERQAQIAREASEAERIARGEVVTPAEASPDGGRPTTTAGAPDAETKDEWTRYVEEFVRRYQLTPEQQSRAYKYLRSLQELRDKYLRRVQPQMTATAQALQEARSDEERDAARQQHNHLMRPLDRMFRQLKEKLDKLPTRRQRLEAAGRSGSPEQHETASENVGSQADSPGRP